MRGPVEESMISKDKTNRRKLPSFYSRSMCVPTEDDRQEPLPDSNGHYAESQLHRHPGADTVARHGMSKMTNENGTPQIPDIRNSADLLRPYISATNAFRPSSLFRGSNSTCRPRAIEAKKIS